jgi:hypothetical protein
MPLGLQIEDDPTNKDIKVDENRTLTVFRDNDNGLLHGFVNSNSWSKDISYGKGFVKNY